MLRSAVASGSALGKEVQACQESGVIPDDLLTKVVLTALASDFRFVERGWLLDGFPRTLAQVGDIGPYVHMAAAG
jgi:adenylate kinase family enzyme